MPAFPKKEVYTVRVIVRTTLEGHDEDGLHLVEIVNPTRTKRNGSTFELTFRMSRFRPMRTTNIDVFLRVREPEPAGNLRVERRMLEAEEEQEHVTDVTAGGVAWGSATAETPRSQKRRVPSQASRAPPPGDASSLPKTSPGTFGFQAFLFAIGRFQSFIRDYGP